MKKAYVKPEIYFESFELSANIATACPKATHTPSDNMCGVNIDGVGMVFLYAIAECKYKGADGDYSTCYHNPDSNLNLFNS